MARTNLDPKNCPSILAQTFKSVLGDVRLLVHLRFDAATNEVALNDSPASSGPIHCSAMPKLAVNDGDTSGLGDNVGLVWMGLPRVFDRGCGRLLLKMRAWNYSCCAVLYRQIVQQPKGIARLNLADVPRLKPVDMQGLQATARFRCTIVQ